MVNKLSEAQIKSAREAYTKGFLEQLKIDKGVSLEQGVVLFKRACQVARDAEKRVHFVLGQLREQLKSS